MKEEELESNESKILQVYVLTHIESNDIAVTNAHDLREAVLLLTEGLYGKEEDEEEREFMLEQEIKCWKIASVSAPTEAKAILFTTHDNEGYNIFDGKGEHYS